MASVVTDSTPIEGDEGAGHAVPRVPVPGEPRFNDLTRPDLPAQTLPKGLSQSPPEEEHPGHLRTPAAHESAGSDEGAGVVGQQTPGFLHVLTREPAAPAPGEFRPRVGLFTYVVRSMSPEALAAEDAKASAADVSLATWIERRCAEIIRTLVRDSAPVALRELRRCRP